ncbi:MAG: DNA translocase FtsK 4TM domain-containing protein, partial [Rickettsiales bacterium]|nr:DNA translocase FtsK 4TM domain-containing protein [Rickettsiales bacterium]
MPNYLPYQVKRGLRIVAVKLLGAALLALAAAAAIGLATYSPLDPSPFSSSTFKTTNAAGPAGAYIAATLLYAFGGAGALVVTAGVFAAGLALTRSKPPAHPPIMTASLAIIATFSASLAATFFDAGGLAGAASLAAIGATGYIGIAVFLLAAVIAAAAIFAMLNVKLSSLAKVRLAAPTPKRIPVKPRAQEKPKPRPSSSPKPTPAARTSSSYRLPPTSLLDEPKRDSSAASSDEVNRKMGKMLEDTLAEFGLEVKVAHIRPGPVITLFETEVGRGIKTSRITSLSEDIARNMAAHSTRVALIPGTNRIGIELPNMKRKMVYLKEQLESDMFATTAHALPISLGSDTSGAPVFVDLAKMPHLLIAGTTGSGKSVGVNAMILSLLYKYSPDEVKMIMIDPKMLEFAVYNDIPHLLIPVVTEPVKAVAALKWAVREMEDRNRNLS